WPCDRGRAAPTLNKGPLPMPFDLPTWAFLLDLVVGLVLTGVIVFMAGALCGAEKLDFLRAMLLGAIYYAVVVPSTWIAFQSFGGSDWRAWGKDLQTLLTAGGTALGVSLVVL